MVLFLQNELIRKDEIIKTLLETQNYIPETVSKPSVEEEILILIPKLIIFMNCLV